MAGLSHADNDPEALKLLRQFALKARFNGKCEELALGVLKNTRRNDRVILHNVGCDESIEALAKLLAICYSGHSLSIEPTFGGSIAFGPLDINRPEAHLRLAGLLNSDL